MFVLAASLLLLINPISMSSITPREIRLRRVCRSCGELAREVQRRLEHTALNPRVITVAGRIGADGRPIPGRKIDYLASESRYLDIFTDICEELDYHAKSGCYLITNEYDDQLREWFNERREESFLESFCFKELAECNKEVVEASSTDIELENYEEDKHLIDDDFMPESKEENVKAEESNFMAQALEKLLNIRDNALDLAEEVDQKVKEVIKNDLLGNRRIREQTDKVLKEEHYELFLKHWWLAVVSILISFLLPIIFVISLQKRTASSSSSSSSSPKSSRGSSKTSKKSASASKLKVPAVNIETSESEAAEADDEKPALSPRKSSRSSRILASSTSNENASPVKRISKRNSKSQSDD